MLPGSGCQHSPGLPRRLVCQYSRRSRRLVCQYSRRFLRLLISFRDFRVCNRKITIKHGLQFCFGNFRLLTLRQYMFNYSLHLTTSLYHFDFYVINMLSLFKTHQVLQWFLAFILGPQQRLLLNTMQPRSRGRIWRIMM